MNKKKKLYNVIFHLQIEWNLVIAPGLAPGDSTQAPACGVAGAARVYCHVPHVEQAYRRRVAQDADLSMRPKFYALTNTEINNQVWMSFFLLFWSTINGK